MTNESSMTTATATPAATRFARWVRERRGRLQRGRGTDAWRVARPLRLDVGLPEPLELEAWVDTAGLDALVAAADLAGMEAAVDAVDAAPVADELALHAGGLVARARAAGADARELRLLARHWGAGAPAADAGPPRTVTALRTMLDDGYARWSQGLQDRLRIRALSAELHLSGYPDLFVQARGMRRRIRILVGPPNSGKTYGAMNRLAEADSGVYLAPLRLLALEGQEALAARGVRASLVTGEERDLVEGSRHVAATVEMLEPNRVVDVAVIDEFQMIFDRDRGWAWTQAIVGAAAHELILVGAAYALPMVERLLRALGEDWTVERFERKAPLEPDRERVIPPDALRHGDALIAFSRRDVLRHKERLERMGRRVAVVYGALSPEVRRREAERFREGEAQVLVATDAIGMGLNLPIARVVFSTLVKWDGAAERLLDASEFHQIAGRAGRFGLHERGRVALLTGAAPGWSALERLFAEVPEPPVGVSKITVAPAWAHVERIAAALSTDDLATVLGVFVERLALANALLEPAPLTDMRALAADVLPRQGLSLRERFVYAQAPAPERPETIRQTLADWAGAHARGRPVRLEDLHPSLRGLPRTPSLLADAETALRTATLYAWLAWRFPDSYPDLEAANAQRRWLDAWIERALRLRHDQERPHARRGAPMMRGAARRPAFRG